MSFAKNYLKEHPEINLFIFGHRHIELDLMLSRSCRLVVLGECYELCTYGVLDDNGFRLLRGVFHSPALQWLFRTFIPTSWAMRFGLSVFY